MSVLSARIAAALAIYAGFALFQSVARGQPWATRVRARSRHAPALVRIGALASLIVPLTMLARDLGWAAAALVATGMLCFVATLFVLLAAIRPRAVWMTAIAAAPLSLIIDQVIGRLVTT